MAGFRNRIGHSKKCVARITAQQARHSLRCVPEERPAALRMGRHGLRCLGVRVECDRCGQEWASRWKEGRDPAAFRPHKTAAKSSCVFLGFCKSGILTSLFLQLQFQEGPLRRVFIVRSSGFLQLLAGGGPESYRARRVCPNIFHTASFMQPASVFSGLYSMTKESPGTSATLC